MLITISAVLKPVALIKHASTRGGNWRCSLLAGARLGRLFGGSIFRAGRPDCPLTQICSINTHYSTWWLWWWGGAGGCLSGQEKELWEARTGKGGKKKEKSKKEVPRKRSAGVGGLQRGSEGPTPRIFLCGCSFGLTQVAQGGVQQRPLARGVETLALRPFSSRRQNTTVRVFMPRAPPAPLPPGLPRGWVSPCALRRQRCWPGEAAGRSGRAGRSPLRSGEPPHRAPGKPEADERRCPLLGLGATRKRRQKRVRGEKVTQTPSPRPTPLGSEPRSPEETGRMVKTGVRGN